MTVAFVNSASQVTATNGTSVTISAFNSDSSGSAVNTVAVFCLATGPTASSPSVTWNGSATGITNRGTLTVSTTSKVTLWDLAGIAGTHNAVFSWTGTDFACGGIISAQGASQSGVTNFGSHAQTALATNALTLTGGTSADLFVIFGEDDGGTAINSMTNGTQRFLNTGGGTGSAMLGATAVGAASTAFTLNLAAADDSGMIGCVIAAAAGADVLMPQILTNEAYDEKAARLFAGRPFRFPWLDRGTGPMGWLRPVLV